MLGEPDLQRECVHHYMVVLIVPASFIHHFLETCLTVLWLPRKECCLTVKPKSRPVVCVGDRMDKSDVSREGGRVLGLILYLFLFE